MSTSGSMRRPVRRFFWASTRKSHGAAPGLFFTKARRFGSRRCARSTASTSARRSADGRGKAFAVLQQAETAGADILEGAVRLVAGRGTARVGALRPGGKIGRVAGADIELALPFPEGAQVGEIRGDVPMPCAATASCKSALASGCNSTAAQGPRWPLSCHSRLTMPQPEHRSAAFWLRRGAQKRASKSASEPNRWTAEQDTSVLLYKISVECSIRPAEILRQNIVSRKMKKICRKEKQQTRLAGLLLLMRYSRAIC